MENWINAKNAAEYLGIQVRTLWAKVRLGLVPAHRLPGSNRLRFKRDELDQFMGVTKAAVKPW